MLAGASVLVFHDSLGQVLAASAVMGLGLGARAETRPAP